MVRPVDNAGAVYLAQLNAGLKVDNATNPLFTGKLTGKSDTFVKKDANPDEGTFGKAFTTYTAMLDKAFEDGEFDFLS